MQLEPAHQTLRLPKPRQVIAQVFISTLCYSSFWVHDLEYRPGVPALPKARFGM